MLGPAGVTDAGVWIQTTRPCRVQLRCWKSGDPGTSRLSGAIETREGEDLIARFTIAGLAPGSRYDYELYLDGQLADLPYPGSLRTAPVTRDRSMGPSFLVALGSCLYINDAPADPPDGPPGGGFEILDAIAAQKPDLMLWTGDNFYFRDEEWTSEERMRSRYRHDRAFPALQRLLASTRHYATWDDHDYGASDSDATFEGKEVSADVFRDYWMNGGDGPGLFSRFTWGDAEFFLLDDRTFRSPNDLPETPRKVMFGPEQMQCLLESLRSSVATFKIVVGGNQLLNPIALYEGWSDFPFEQQRFLAALRNQRTPGVFFVSGDRHHTELIVRREQGLYPLYDLTCSPLTSRSHKVTDERNNPARVPGTLVTQRNFCTLRFEGPSKDRVVVLSVFDTGGQPLWARRLRASELTFGEGPAAIPILLAGEPIHLDDNFRPWFTDAQVRGSAESTRAGFTKWAATSEGQRIIARVRAGDLEISVAEDPEEIGTGRAPQPGIATLLAAGDRTKLKRYSLILNPALAAEYGRHRGLAFGDPVTPIDVMAGAWAGEMLHIDFYAQGIPLPHHDRANFQERWRAVASELGFPIMKHETQ